MLQAGRAPVRAALRRRAAPSSTFFSAAMRPTASSTGAVGLPPRAIAARRASLRAWRASKRSPCRRRGRRSSERCESRPPPARALAAARRHEGACACRLWKRCAAATAPAEARKPSLVVARCIDGSWCGSPKSSVRCRASARAASAGHASGPGVAKCTSCRHGCARNARHQRAAARASPKRISRYIGIAQPAVRSSSAASSGDFARLARPDQLDDVTARALSKRTVRSTVNETPFSSGGKVSVT